MTGLPVADRRPSAGRSATVAGDRRAVAVVLVLHSAAAVAGLAAPWLLGRIVDEVTAGAGVATVDRLALAIAGCVLAQGLLARYAQYAGHRSVSGPSPGCGRSSSAGPSTCRSRWSSGPAPATWPPAVRSTSRRSAPPCATCCR